MTEHAERSAQPRVYDIVAVSFVAFLLISNIAATKVTALDAGPIHLVFDGGAVLFPLTYILGDVLSEVYGFARARRVIIMGFVPRIVAASIGGYLVGQLMNSLVLVKIRQRWGAKHLWARLIGSTLVGEAFDTVIFCTIAFAGIIPGMEFVNYIVTGYVYKVGIEVVFLPITYRVIALVRRVEHLKSDEVLA